jgi:hypothetical protein
MAGCCPVGPNVAGHRARWIAQSVIPP